MNRAFVALGSNLGDRRAHLCYAVGALPGVVAVSGLYETDPVGGPDGQGAYLNCVVELDTELGPEALLDRCLEIEAERGRERRVRWGERTLDCDVLLHGDTRLDTERLTLPHPRMYERRFVLEPLRDLAPELVPADWQDRPPSGIRRVADLDCVTEPTDRVGGRLRMIGPGRAGSAVATAAAAAGWTVVEMLGRGDELIGAARDVDLCVLATPDRAVAEVAAAIEPQPDTVVVHLAGSLTLEALAPHPRRASLHPLASLPDADRGARVLAGGAAVAVAGDRRAWDLARDWGARLIEVDEAARVEYHAAASIAANHLVALLAQVERVAGRAGVELDAYLDMARATIDNVAERGPAGALTGPVSRGDGETVRRHLAVLGPQEGELYRALADAAAELAGWPTPVDAPGWPAEGEGQQWS